MHRTRSRASLGRSQVMRRPLGGTAGPEIEGMARRQLRMRLITIEPGGATAVHTHKDRPGTVYVLQGKITDYRDRVATEYGPGVGWPENNATTHWIRNNGTTPAVEISVDIFKQP